MYVGFGRRYTKAADPEKLIPLKSNGFPRDLCATFPMNFVMKIGE